MYNVLGLSEVLIIRSTQQSMSFAVNAEGGRKFYAFEDFDVVYTSQALDPLDLVFRFGEMALDLYVAFAVR